MMSGIKPRINGGLLELHNAKMLSYKVGEPEYTNGYFRPPRSIFPIRTTPEIGLRPVSFVLDFEGRNMHDIMLSISNFTAMLHKEADLYLPDGFFYWAAFESASTPEEKAPWILQVKYSFSGVRHGGLRKHLLPAGAGTKQVFVEGNYEAPVVYTVTPKVSGQVTVGGITIKNVSAGVPVVLDGIRKKVTASGLNKYGDTDMLAFPKLQSGRNIVEVVGNADVTVEYYPIYM